MKTDPAIQRYDRLMLRDLGSNPTYSWKWSEDLIRVMDAVSPGDGKPVLDVIPYGSILIAQQAKATRKLAPDLVNQWCICALIDPYTEDGRLNGSGRAIWMPVRTKTKSHPVALPPNQHPNQADTENFIAQMRRTRVRDAEEMGKWEDFNKPNTVPMDESERNTMMMSRAEKKKFEEYKLRFKDNFTAFGEEPGRLGSTSFPKTAKEMEADFEEYEASLKPPETAIVQP